MAVSNEHKSLLKEVYLEFFPDVYRYALSITQNNYTAQDIAGDTFLKLVEKLDQIDFSSKQKIKFLLIKISRNLIIDRYKSKKLKLYDESLYDDSTFNQTESFLEELINKDELNRVRQFVLQLSPLEQEIINLRIWQELSFDQIALIQNRDIGACKMHFYRTINKIKNNFDYKRL